MHAFTFFDMNEVLLKNSFSVLKKTIHGKQDVLPLQRSVQNSIHIKLRANEVDLES